MGGNLSHFRCLACWVVELIASVRLIQVENNRNDHFRYFLGVRVRLKKTSFQVNKGNKFGDYCPLNRGCPLNTGFIVLKMADYNLLLVVIPEDTRKSEPINHKKKLGFLL